MIVLLVTWIVAGQPPSSYRQEFTSAQACASAKSQIESDATRMKQEQDQRNAETERRTGGTIIPADPPRVSVVCVAK
jgi:hypothetical protein